MIMSGGSGGEKLISSEQGWIFVSIIGLVKNNQSARRQDDGDCILNNDALMMAVVLLFDGAVNDYGGDSDSGDSLLSAEGGDLSQQQR